MRSRFEKKEAERKITEKIPEGWDPKNPPGIYGEMRKRISDIVAENKWRAKGDIEIYPAEETEYGKKHDIWMIIVWRLEDGIKAAYHVHNPHIDNLKKNQTSALMGHLALEAANQLKGEMGGKLGRRFEARAVEIRPGNLGGLEEAIEYLKAHQPPGHNPGSPKGLIANLIKEIRKRTREKVSLFTAIGDHIDYEYGIDIFVTIGETDIYIDLTVSSGKDYFKADMLIREQDLDDQKRIKALADQIMKIYERKKKDYGK